VVPIFGELNRRLGKWASVKQLLTRRVDGCTDSLHLYHFCNWQDRAANRSPSVRSSTSGDISTTSSFVRRNPEFAQSKQLGHIFDDIL
jgi:hypothetical protein